jgi:hypothetical protein
MGGSDRVHSVVRDDDSSTGTGAHARTPQPQVASVIVTPVGLIMGVTRTSVGP